VPTSGAPTWSRCRFPASASRFPPNFAATKEAYVDWLIGEIARLGSPVDLVGHDWGSLLVQRVVALRSDLIRTWACGEGPVDVEYVWHDLAQQGCGHWWPLERPAEAAGALERFWAG
jgi:pimeloyl-ACP methyl ester carboxylesterase